MIKDSEIDIYNNLIKNINSLIIFDFDRVEIKNLQANERVWEYLYARFLPFYENSILSKKISIWKLKNLK